VSQGDKKSKLNIDTSTCACGGVLLATSQSRLAEALNVQTYRCVKCRQQYGKRVSA
jgi:uncharacterized protein with PIN domain